MPRKKVSFVSPNFQQGPKEFNAYYLPYSPGVIWSYANQYKHIQDNYYLGDFVWRRDPIQQSLELIEDSHIVGFSNYIWNKNYNNVLARELKKVNPNVLIIVGGPEPPITNPDFFKLYPYVDLVVKQEGEISFRKILEQLLLPNGDFKSIPGLLVNDNGKTVDTGSGQRIDNLDIIPSPYLSGVFDKLFEEYPEVTWNATIESNRGCPYACTFCDWGSLTYNKVKKFNLERVFDELEFIGKNKCDFMALTDANFGIFPERDMMIATKLIETRQKYDNPKAYTISWAKNQKQQVVDIVKKLITEGGAKIGLNLSVQTMNEDVLETIKRKNLEQHKIEEVFDVCEANNIPLFTELILGLPSETLDSWKNNFYTLYKAGNHTGITVYQAQLLENAEMNLTQREEFQLEGRTVWDYIVGSSNEPEEIREGLEVVVSTKHMPRADMLQAQLHSWMQNTFHINGITNFISRTLYKKYNIEYSEFYEKLYRFIQSESWFFSEIERISHHYENWTRYGRIDHKPIMGMEIHGWNLIHSTIINIHGQNKHDYVFDMIKRFLTTNFAIEDNLINDLIVLQQNFFIDYKQITQYPKQIRLSHDIPKYVQEDIELQKEIVYTFDFPENKNMSLQQFCEQIFFARRRNFGKAWLSYA
jgi:putative methyltransferase